MRARSVFILSMMLWGFATYHGVQALDEGPVFKKQKFAKPLREQSVIVTPEGYYPKTISVFQGERVRFFVTSTTEERQCLILKGKDLYLPAEKGKLSEGDVLFDQLGTYEFYCPGLIEKGHIMVLKKPEDVKREQTRKMASESLKIKVWMPREE